MSEEIRSVGQDFPIEQARCRELLEVYRNLGPVGAFGAAMIEQVLRKADEAASSGDVVQMIIAYQAMKDCE
jgi:hypothetical protein